MQRYGSSIEAVMGMGAHAGAKGFGTADVTGYTPKAVDNCCRRLVEQEHLFKVKVGHRTVRYFTQKDWADAYEKNHVENAPMVTMRSARATWAPPCRGVITPVEGVTARTKFTRCPSASMDGFHTSTHEE